MKKVIAASVVVAVLIIPAIGAAPVLQQQSAPRDLSAHDAALQDVNDKAVTWSTAVGESDTARAAYEAALQELNDKLAAEATARADYEAAQQAYSDAYDAVPKEDSLAP